MPHHRKDPPTDGPDAPSSRVRQPADRRQEALTLLIQARESLIGQMADEIVLNRDAIVGDSSQAGLFGFEFQEIEDRFLGRLNALNAILDSLEYRSVRIVNKTEVLVSTRKKLKKELNDLVEKHDQWDLVNVATTRLGEDQILAVVAFTADESPPAEAGSEGDSEEGPRARSREALRDQADDGDDDDERRER